MTRRHWLRMEPPLSGGVCVAYELREDRGAVIDKVLARIERTSRGEGRLPSKWRVSAFGNRITALSDGMDAAMIAAGRVVVAVHGFANLHGGRQ